MKTFPNRLSLRANNRSFRVLQVTDWHSDQDADAAERTRADVRALVAQTQPDLVAVTGDIWCADDDHVGQARAVMNADLETLASLGVPWAFVPGNHDYYPDRNWLARRFAQTPNAVAPRGDGRGSFIVEVTGDGAEPLWELYFVNSALEWNPLADIARFRKLVRSAPSEPPRAAAIFTHIPLRQYEDARLSGDFTGDAHEEVLCWGDDGRMLRAFQRALAVRGGLRFVTCGHSHENDFTAVVDRVTLTYGRVTGYGGYGEKLQRGGKLFRLSADGSFKSEHVFSTA